MDDVAAATRAALRRMAKSVCVLSSLHEGRRYAMAATAADVVSLDPASMVVSVNRQASFHAPLAAGADFVVNVLARGQEAVARAAGGGLRGEERFGVGVWTDAPCGLPWLDGAEANIVCANAATLGYGTHGLFVGTVRHVRVGGAALDPLVYVDGRYTGVSPA